VLATAFCANEYLDFDIKGWIVSLNTFEEQLTVTMFAVRGWQRFNEVAHMLPPSCDSRRNERGTLKKVPSIAIWRKVRRVDPAWPLRNLFARQLGVKPRWGRIRGSNLFWPAI
jgi:hypothetical protein